MTSLSLLILFVLNHSLGLASSKMDLGEHREHEPNLPVSTDEYCHFETFHPKCSANEIIQIKSAIYGRMRIGKCITAEEVSALGEDTRNTRYFGCSIDVMNILVERCPMASECEVKIPDPELDRTQHACLPGLKLYLEAGYECLQVVESDRNCHVMALYSAKHLIVTEQLASSANCGSNVQPWVIESPKGQRVKVTYVGIGSKKTRGSRVSHRCSAANQGIVIDKLGRRNVSVCEGSEGWSLEDDQQYYQSEGSVLQIILNQRGVEKVNPILKIEAIGCSDIIPPEDAWLKRNTDAIVIGCYSSKQTWHLHCDNRQWIGVVGNCSTDTNSNDLPRSNSNNDFATEIPNDQQVLIIIAICGFGIVVCLTIVCFGAICVRRLTSVNKNWTVQEKISSTLPYRTIQSNDPRFASYRTSMTNGNRELVNPIILSNQPPTYSTYAGNHGNRRFEHPNDVTDSMNGDDAKYFVLDQMAVAEENAALRSN